MIFTEFLTRVAQRIGERIARRVDTERDSLRRVPVGQLPERLAGKDLGGLRKVEAGTDKPRLW
jgi:hypothetical protein